MEDIEKIVIGELRPFITDLKGDDYYSPMFRGLTLITPNFHPHYKISFPAPLLSSKIKYYKRLVDNNITSELNKLFELLDRGEADLILFHRKKLFEKIKSYLEDTQRYIVFNQFDLSEITSKYADFSVNFQHNECTYIFNYILTALIRCYLEFQAHYIQYIEEDKQYSISDFYIQILKKQTPENTFITEIPDIIPIEENLPIENVKKSTSRNDILSFLYKNLDTNPEAVTNLFHSLRDVVRLIDSQTRLTDFKKVFSGKEVVNPIIWTGTPTELYYFIKYIHNIQKSVEDAKKQQWKITCHCFIGENNVCFDKSKLKSLKDPNPQSIAKIEKAANNLTV
jgi:hypothetical protein